MVLQCGAAETGVCHCRRHATLLLLRYVCSSVHARASVCGRVDVYLNGHVNEWMLIITTDLFRYCYLKRMSYGWMKLGGNHSPRNHTGIGDSIVVGYDEAHPVDDASDTRRGNDDDLDAVDNNRPRRL